MATDARPVPLSPPLFPRALMSSKTWTLIAAVLGSSIVFLDSAVLPVALREIGQVESLFVDVLEAQNYVQNGYLLTLSSVLVLAGALSDFHGRRRMFVVGLVGFGITSLLCALAPNLETLILARIAQGASGAILVPGSLAILTNNFEGEEQGRAFGVWAAASGAAPILGPFVGGLLVAELSWRWIFLLNLPLIAIAIWAARRHVTESRDDAATGNIDWLGALLVAFAVGGISFGSIFGQQRQWQDPLAFWALGIGLLATVGLPLYFARRRNPLVPLSMFRSRNFSVTNLSTLLIYGSLYTVFLFQPIYMLGALGYSPPAVGLALIPGTLFLVALSTRFGTFAARYGPRWFMTVGPLIMACGVLLLARVPSDSEAWTLRLGDASTYLPSIGYLVDFLPASLVFGFGISVMVAPLTTALMRSVPGRQAGLASAINNAISRAGPLLAGALIFIIVTATFYSVLGDRLPGLDVNSPDVRSVFQPLNPPTQDVSAGQLEASRAASTEAFHLAMLTAAGLLVLGALANGLWISNRQALAAGQPPIEAVPPGGTA
jgi:EmrB/QacA subfamily drug resistance transporter